MDEEPKNKTFDQDVLKTPEIRNRNLRLRKTKSSYNNSNLETDPSSTSKKAYNTKMHLALVSKFLSHQNSVKQFNTINNSKVMNKTFDTNAKKSKNSIKNKKLNIEIEKDDYKNRIILNTDFNDKNNNIKVDKKYYKNINLKTKILDNKKSRNGIKSMNLYKSNTEKNIRKNEKNKLDILNKMNKKQKNKDKNNINEIKSKIKSEKNEKISKKIKDEKNKNKINEIKKENKTKNINGINKEIKKRNNIKFNTINKSNTYEYNIKEEKKIKSKKLNIEIKISLPPRKSVSPKAINHNLIFDKKALEIKDIRYSPKLTNKIISFEKSPQEEIKKLDKIDKKKDNEKVKNRIYKKDKERIEKGVLTPRKIELKQTKKNSATDDRNNSNLRKQSAKEEKREFLFIPHIVLDPLDVLENKVEIILSQFENKINNLNKSSSENNIQNLIKKSHEEYIIKLNEIYNEREKELLKIKHIYREKINSLLNTDNKEEEKQEENKNESEKIIEERDNKIIEIEKKFIENKNNIKNEFINKTEEIKKLYDPQKQINLNKEFIEQIKKKLVKIFNDKKLMNKRGINFSLRDYKNSIKNNKIKDNKDKEIFQKK